jgi:hypothetical protein
MLLRFVTNDFQKASRSRELNKNNNKTRCFTTFNLGGRSRAEEEEEGWSEGEG